MSNNNTIEKLKLKMFPDKTLIQQNKEETVNHDIFHSSISSQGQHPFIEAISSYASFSFSQNPSSFHKIFEDSLDEDLLESSTKQTSIKHIVLKYALDDNDLYSESSHTNNRKILSVKEKVIMNALINFHQNIIKSEPTKVIEYTPQSDYPQEMKLYIAVENSVRNKLINGQSSSSNKTDIFSCVNLGKLLYGVRGKNKTLEFFAIKVIIISMINLLNEIVSGLITSFTYPKTTNVDIEIFVRLYKKFVFMCSICPYIEKDYSLTFDSFKKKYQMNFTLCELFSDIFWDVVFSYKQLTCCFISNINGQVTEIVHGTMMKIITALWITVLPLKKQISELLDIEKIIGPKPDLATFVVQQKEANDKDYLHDEEFDSSWNLFNFNDEKTSQSINVNMVIETKQEDTSKENLTKEEKSKKEVTTVSTGTNTIISKAETKSLEEIYNDIVNANNGASNSKRRSKKKNKRKKSPREEEDPIVEQFKSELCGKVVNAGEIQKIKPMISSEWIQKITLNA